MPFLGGSWQWKVLVNYVKGQEPKITPGASQENILLPCHAFFLASSDPPWRLVEKSLSKILRCLDGYHSLTQHPLRFLSRHNRVLTVLWEFTLKMKLELVQIWVTRVTVTKCKGMLEGTGPIKNCWWRWGECL